MSSDMLGRLNPALSQVPPSGIRRFARMASEKEGCISLTLGEPDFATPEPVKAWVSRSLERDMTHYPPTSGIPELRQAIADFTCRRRGYECSPSEIIVTCGATEALFTALFSIVEPGDEVIIFEPAFILYESIITLLRGRAVRISTAETGFQPDPEALKQALTPRTKAVILNSPSNPSGTVYTEATLEGLHQVLRDNDIFVICDDVYGQLAFDDTYRSFASYRDMRDRIITADSFSKPYAMTGWRMGWLTADRPVIAAMEKVHQFSMVSVPAFLQPACVAALRYDPSSMRESYRCRSDYVLGRLLSMGLPCIRPGGGFYLFPSIAEYGLSSEEFCTRLITEAGVALTPGSCFGGEGHVRISCCQSMENLQEALDRMEMWLKQIS